MLKLLLLLLFILPSIPADNGTYDYLEYDNSWDDFDDSFYDDDDSANDAYGNCTRVALALGRQMDVAFERNLTQKLASEMTGNCYQMQNCVEQEVFGPTNSKTYFPNLGKHIDPVKLYQNLCTALDSMSGPLGECFDKIRDYNKTELMANSWASLGPNRKKDFENHKVLNTSEHCFSIMNPYSQSLIDKDCTPKAVEEFGKVSKSMKYISCMVMGFFSVPDFYRYIESI